MESNQRMGVDSTYGALHEFDPNVHQWDFFLTKMKQFYFANNIEDSNKQRALFLNALNDNAFSLMLDLCMPDKPEDTTFGQLIDLFNSHFNQKRAIFAERDHFYKAKKNKYELCSDWAARVQRLATHCNFGNYLNNIICDKFILGYNNGKIKDKLFLSDEKISFQEAVHQAKKYETLETKRASNTTYKQLKFFNRRRSSSNVTQNIVSSSAASSRCSGSPRVKQEPLDLYLVGSGKNTHYSQKDLSPNHSNSRNDKDFDTFEKLLKERHFKESNYKKIQEIQKDLFDMPPTYSLAHCVAEDMNMGSGIAVQFSQKFKSRDKLYDQRQRQGGLAVLPDDNRYIYYLVTKRLSNGKPTMYTMWNSLQKLQQHMHENDVKALAIPRIGCGLDRLEWSAVKAMIEYTFKDTNMEITVCNFQQPEEDAFVGRFQKQSKCLLKNVSYPLVDIETMTAIVYFGTEDGHISDDLESLDTKFHIIGEYTRATRKLGEIIQTPKHNQEYILFGCIVRKSQNEQFDFIQFQKCVYQIKKSIKSKYGYVAIQAFLDNKDDLILNKIINMLRFSLIKVEVYVCWGGKMLSYMPAERGGDY